MYISICVPVAHRELFAPFVDDTLSRELDWFLLAYHQAGSVSRDRTSLALLAELAAVSADMPYLKSVFSAETVEALLRSESLASMDLWVFALSPMNQVMDVDSVINLLQALGCFVGLSPFPPSADSK